MSSTNRVQVAVGRATDSQHPTQSIPALQRLRITGAPSLAFQPNTIVSDEIRSDRQRSDLIPVGAEAGGDVNGELSYGATDELISAAMFNQWSDPARTLIAGTGAGTVDAAAGEGDRFLANHVVRILDIPSGVDLGNAVYTVDSVAVDTVTLSPFDGNTNAIASQTLTGASLAIVGYTAVAGDLTATESNGVVTLTASGSASFAGIFDAEAATDLVPGQFIKLSGSADSLNNVWAQLITVSASALTFAFDTNANLDTDDLSGDAMTLFFGGYVQNGAENLDSHVFIVDERFLDHTPVSIISFLRMALGNMNITLEPQAIAQFVATFFGTTAEADTSESNLYGGSPTISDAPTFDVFNTSSNIGRLGRGSDAINASNVNCVLNATVEINNNLERNNAVGVFGACSISVGELSVSGELSTYFDDLSLYQDLIAGAETSIDLGLRSLDGRALLIDMPRVKFNGGAPQVPGKNQQVTLPLGYDALLDPTLGYTISFQRFDYSL